MDENVRFVVEERIKRTMEQLKKNRMEAYYAPTKEEARQIALGLLHEGDVISCGGSMSIAECGLLEAVRQSGQYRFLDRARPGITPEEIEKLYRDTFFCDVYLASSNAVTEQGELFNVDGNSNRVAAMLYGPKSVIVIAGYNKIVPDLAHAVQRLEQIAAPANAKRLSCKTPCAVTGVCQHCRGDARICSSYVVMSHQRQAGRVKVILVGEELGY